MAHEYILGMIEDLRAKYDAARHAGMKHVECLGGPYNGVLFPVPPNDWVGPLGIPVNDNEDKWAIYAAARGLPVAFYAGVGALELAGLVTISSF